MSLDEGELLRKVVEATGIAARIATTKDGAPAAFVDDVVIDAPEGWLRIATTIERPEIDIVSRANLGLLFLETGLGHVHYAAGEGVVRIAASLPAVTAAPTRAAVLGTMAHLSAVRRKILTGEGDIRANCHEGEASDGPSLADVARVAGRALLLVPEKGSFVGGLRDPKSGTECALRLHTAMPGVLAADAWLLPPTRTEPNAALIERLDVMNATLAAGAMLLVPSERFIVYRWACPYRWLSLEELEAPALAYTALAAFTRWRAS